MRNRIISESSIHFTLAFWLLVLLLIKLGGQGVIIFKTFCIFSHFRCKELLKQNHRRVCGKQGRLTKGGHIKIKKH